ncbi:MAG TPA: DNA repair protein RecO [Chloroflexi bacterium]|nr:DNA repair protein RecO [Chloroflexota bacterium]
MPQERLYRTEGIVLREMDYAEADRILTLLTPGGKMTAIAHGIRRPTSRKVGHLGLFYRAQLLLARGRNLDVITQAESLEEFEGIRSDLLRFTYACYAGELMDRFAQEEEESAELYELLTHGLRWLAVERDLRLWMRYFELRLLAFTGYQPQLFACVACHRRLAPEKNYFSAEHGGLLCPECARNEPVARGVSVAAQKVLRYLQTHDDTAVRALRITETTHAEMESLLQTYIEYVLERELKSTEFLRRLRAELRAAEAMSGPSEATDEARASGSLTF